MAKARRAKSGNKVTIIVGEHDGEKGIALEDGENLNSIRVRLTTGPNSGRVVRITTGNYIVGG